MGEFYSKHNFFTAANENSPKKKRENISKLEKKDIGFKITIMYMKKENNEGWKYFTRYLNIKAKDVSEARKKAEDYIQRVNSLGDEVAHAIRKIEVKK